MAGIRNKKEVKKQTAERGFASENVFDPTNI